jgi:hypothetical protein
MGRFVKIGGGQFYFVAIILFGSLGRDLELNLIWFYSRVSLGSVQGTEGISSSMQNVVETKPRLCKICNHTRLKGCAKNKSKSKN